MTSLLKNLGLVLALAIVVFSSNVHVFAATQGAADYRSSLTTGISSSDTSLTVVSTSTPSGEYLMQGSVYGLKLGGREYVLGTLGAGKTFSSLTRGVSNLNGTTTGGVASSWGRGSAVEITDAPVLLEILNKIAGRQFFDNVLRYTGISTTTLATNGSNLASVDYVNSVSFGAVGQASETTAGFVELATGAEAAAGTSAGATTARLALPASLATSTYNSATAANRIPVTDGTGKLDGNFLPTTIPNAHTYSGASTFSADVTLSGATSNIASTTVYATTTTGTWTKPSNLKFLIVELVGAGGDGATDNSYSGGGGGGSGYCKKVIPAAAIGSTVSVTVGAATSTSSSFGSFLTATGGTSATNQTGGAGGTCTVGGDVSIPGEQGGDGMAQPGGGVTYGMWSGKGGNSVLGFGGSSVSNGSATGVQNGRNGKNYGSGGSGSNPATDNNPPTGMPGFFAPGIVIITSVFF